MIRRCLFPLCTIILVLSSCGPKTTKALSRNKPVATKKVAQHKQSNLPQKRIAPQQPRTTKIVPYKNNGSRTKQPASLQQTSTTKALKQPISTPTQTTIEQSQKQQQSHQQVAYSVPKKNGPAVSFTNSITNEMLSYTKFPFGTFHPSTFNVSVNGEIIAQQETKSIHLANNECIIRYNFSFHNGYRTGAKEFKFIIPSATKEVKLTFNWKRNVRILAECLLVDANNDPILAQLVYVKDCSSATEGIA